MRALAVAGAAVLAACAPRTYEPVPLDPAASSVRLMARSLDDPGLAAFAERHGRGVPAWPPQSWTLDLLSLAAVYFDPDLAAARARWQRRQAAEATAAQRPNPSLAPLVEYDQEPDQPGDSPWTVGLAFEVPFVAGGKREARVAAAQALSEAARLEVAGAAWRRRAAVRDAFLACHEGEALLDQKRHEGSLHEEIAEIFERRRAVGEASLTEVSLARQGLEETRLAAASLLADIESCRGRLAGALGIAYDAARALRLDSARLMPPETVALPSDAMRLAALGGGLDLRAALSRYAAAEAALRLEIARQYPDLTLSPGLFWDQGGLVWSLASNIVLAVSHRNEGPIGEAEAERRALAREVIAVQGRILSDLAHADSLFQSTLRTLDAAVEMRDRQHERLEVAERRLQQGDVGRLAVTEARLRVSEAETVVLGERLKLLRVQAAFEDIVEQPLIDRASALDPESLAGLAVPRAGQ
jgi:outer membrane protein TolC